MAAAFGCAPGAYAATGGEDYELLVALDPAALDGLGVPLTVIGRVEPGQGRVELVGRGAAHELQGWDHLGSANAGA